MLLRRPAAPQSSLPEPKIRVSASILDRDSGLLFHEVTNPSRLEPGALLRLTAGALTGLPDPRLCPAASLLDRRPGSFPYVVAKPFRRERAALLAPPQPGLLVPVLGVALDFVARRRRVPLGLHGDHWRNFPRRA